MFKTFVHLWSVHFCTLWKVFFDSLMCLVAKKCMMRQLSCNKIGCRLHEPSKYAGNVLYMYDPWVLIDNVNYYLRVLVVGIMCKVQDWVLKP